MAIASLVTDSRPDWELGTLRGKTSSLGVPGMNRAPKTEGRQQMSKVYEIVTEQILAQLEQGVVPWSRPWKVDGLAPANLATGRAYRGINVLLLGFRAGSTPWWLTFRQAKALGGSIRRGEKSAPVVFWNWMEKPEHPTREEDAGGEGTKQRFPVLRYYRVFNLDQVEGIDEARIPAVGETPLEPLVSAEQIVEGYPDPPAIEHRAQPRASYAPSRDTVTMPPRDVFDSANGYYSTLFHELAHSTGHVRRLARPSFERNHAAPFGSDEYAREELVAELGAAFLCGEAGIDPDVSNSAAYIEGWREQLTRDPRLIVTAAQQAQKAVDHVLDRGKEPTAQEA